MILKKSVLKVFEFIFIIGIPLLFIAFVVYSMFNDELGISWIKLVSMWLLSFAIITFSTYLHEFGHKLRIKHYSKTSNPKIRMWGIKGVTHDDEYYKRFKNTIPSKSKELRDNLLAGVRFSMSIYSFIGVALAFLMPFNFCGRVTLASMLISIFLQVLNASDIDQIINDTLYQTPKGQGKIEGLLWAFTCASACTLCSMLIQVFYQASA